jgi:hypothetical protein
MTRFLRRLGASMRSIALIRSILSTSRVGVVRYLAALTIITGLLIVWAGLCAI